MLRAAGYPPAAFAPSLELRELDCEAGGAGEGWVWGRRRSRVLELLKLHSAACALPIEGVCGLQSAMEKCMKQRGERTTWAGNA